MRRFSIGMASSILVAALLLAFAEAAAAAPITIDFESGAAPNEQVTDQYCCPGGVDKGPTFMNAAAKAGFNAGSNPGLSGLQCGPPFLDAEDQASSGTRAIRLIGCPTTEFTGTAGFFKLNWPTDSVEFQVGLASETPASCPNFICAEIWTTAFRANRTIVMQQQTLLGPNTKFKTVPLISGSSDIAFVAIERGSRASPTDSDTGVALALGSPYLVVDDLTYDPPSSPPESSFLLGASPSVARFAPGAKSPQIKIPVTWTANPNPAASPVSLELTAPPGITGTFTPPVTTSGESKLVLEAEKSVKPGKFTVTVDGYVDKGESSEKHSSIQIPVEITEPFTLDQLAKYPVSRCTPVEVPIRIPKDPGIPDPIEVFAQIQGNQSKFIATTAGSINKFNPRLASATLNQPGNEAKMTLTVGIELDALAEDVPIVVTAAPTGYAMLESKGTIAIEPIRVDSVSPPTPEAPQLGKPGTQVTVKGAGFCPGDKVAIGPVEDTANPDSISTPGNTLTFRIPRGAVSGALRILPLKGTPYLGPKLPVSSFRNTRGFSWENQDYGMRFTGEMMDDLYGEDETNINVLGWLVRKPEAGLLGEVTNKYIPDGICFGMGFSVAQMFDAPSWVDVFPHSAHSVWGLDGPKKPSDGVLRFVTQRFSLQFSDEVIPLITGQVIGQAINAHDPSADIDEIRSLVGPGKPPLLLGVMGGGGFGAHTILAYDWEPGPNDTTLVDVYNPNEPYTLGEESQWATHTEREFKRSVLTVRNSDSHWELPDPTTTKAVPPWEGGDSGLVIFPHDKLPILNGKRPHVPNVFVAAAIAVFGSSKDRIAQVEDDSGRRLLAKGEPADPKRWPRGVAPFASFTGSSGPLQMLATDTGKAGRITATVRRGKGGGAMELALPGTRTSLEAGVHPGQVDHVTVDDRAGEIGYSPGRTTPFGGSLVSGPGGAASSAAATAAAKERTADFQTTSSKGGDTISFSHGREFTIEHDGSPAALALTLSGPGADRLPVAVRLPRARLARGERLTAAPTNWRQLGSSPIRVTTRVHGRTSTRLVKGRRLGRSFAAVRGAKLDASGARLTLALRLKHPPKGAAVSPVVDVLRGRRVVSRSRPARLTGASMARPILALTRPLKGGSYTLRVRLLETVEVGLGQSATVVRKRLHLRAGR